MTETQTIEVIKESITRILPGSDVLLFGSRPKRQARPDSDYDILVITEQEMKPSEKMPFRTRIRKALLAKGIFSDILIQSKREVDTKKQLTGHFVKTILAEGVRI